jgi:hypothetical protein
MAGKVHVLGKNPMGSIYNHASYCSILAVCKALYVGLHFGENALVSLCRY